MEHFHLVNLRVVRIDTSYLSVDILLAISDSARRAILRPHFVDGSFEILGRVGDVTLLQANPSAFLQSVVRL